MQCDCASFQPKNRRDRSTPAPVLLIIVRRLHLDLTGAAGLDARLRVASVKQAPRRIRSFSVGPARVKFRALNGH